MSAPTPLVLLLQLPIPPPGLQPIHGNVPLAAGYLKLFARRRGCDASYRIELLPPSLSNTLGDQGIVEAIVDRRPWMVGFTCFLWNVDRTLWIAAQVKRRLPEVTIVLGGPEITADNDWLLAHPAIDYAAFGEGEQTFVDLLTTSAARGDLAAVPGLWTAAAPRTPQHRGPLANLDEISSPYLEGILDAADEQMLFLETARGCLHKCRFCYYPKSYEGLYQLSRDKVLANLRHATERGAREVFLLDPTLNQRRDFVDFIRLLAEGNPGRQFTYSAELRAEGITDETATLLRQANFTEVEIGLQSVDRHTQELMNRRVNQKAFLRGAQAMLDAGMRVRIDLILGLPGDTVDSVRRGIELLAGLQPQCQAQIFNLSILPGTSFRHDARQLGLTFQPRPPYYAIRTPTLSMEQMVELMDEAQQAFGIEFDPFPPPTLDLPADAAGPQRLCRIDLDRVPGDLPPASQRAQAMVLWLRSARFRDHAELAAALIARLLDDNPHTTLQVVLEPTNTTASNVPPLTVELLDTLLAACFRSTSYLDRFYSLHPSRLMGAKRLVVLLPCSERSRLGLDWVDDIGQYAAIVWRGGQIDETDLALHEYVVE
jgi:hypothetical protein